MQAKERLWLNADKSKLLPEGHVEAAMLYATPGDEIPDESAARFGLKDGALPVKRAAARTSAEASAGKKDGGKQAAKGGNKQAAKGGNKKGGLTVNKAKKE